MNTRGIKVTVVVLLLALTACGGGANDAEVLSTTSSSTTAATTTTTAAPNPAADRAAAQALLLTKADMPTGWIGSPHQADPGSDILDQQFATCAGASDPSKATADIDGDDFDLGDATVGSSVSVTATRAEFEQDVAALRSPKFVSCTKEIFQGDEFLRQLQADTPGVTIGSVDVTSLTVPTYGEVTEGMRLKIAIAGSGRSLSLYLDTYAYGRDRMEATLTFTNVGAPFDADLEQKLLVKATNKLKASA